MVTTRRRAARTRYDDLRETPDFRELRARIRRFVVPVTVAVCAWYFLYVLLASYARDFMAVKVVGNVNIGLILGLLQFVSSFAVTVWYLRYAESRIDPLARKVRADVEDDA